MLSPCDRYRTGKNVLYNMCHCEGYEPFFEFLYLNLKQVQNVLFLYKNYIKWI